MVHVSLFPFAFDDTRGALNRGTDVVRTTQSDVGCVPVHYVHVVVYTVGQTSVVYRCTTYMWWCIRDQTLVVYRYTMLREVPLKQRRVTQGGGWIYTALGTCVNEW